MKMQIYENMLLIIIRSSSPNVPLPSAQTYTNNLINPNKIENIRQVQSSIPDVQKPFYVQVLNL